MMTPQESWTAAHDAAGEGLAWLGPLATAIVCAALAVHVLWGLAKSRGYRVDVALDDDAREEVHDAVRAAERGTVGEVVPVVVGRSDRHPGAAWLAAFLWALVGSLVAFEWLPWRTSEAVLVTQVVFGLAGYGLARALPAFRRTFVSAARASEVAEEQAFQEFYRCGLHRTEGATGVLVFVSLFERRVVVLADEGIDGAAAEGFWESVDAAVLDGIRAGSLGHGLADGVRAAGELLAEHAPWREGDRNELPDRVIVRPE